MQKVCHEKNRIGMELLLVCMLFFLCGCGKDFHGEIIEESERMSTDQVVVGFSQVGSESMWRSANTKSVQQSLSRGKGYFLIFHNARQKQEKQIKDIRSFISQQVDYIVFSPIAETGWETVLQEAKDAGIPVILMDRRVQVEDESLYTTWIGSDFVLEGKKAGESLEKILKSQGREEEEIHIAILRGTEGASSAIGRQEGFMEIAEKHSNWIIVAQENGDYTTNKGREVMEMILGHYGEVDVLISQNDDMTIGALEAIEKEAERRGIEKNQIIVISFDATLTGLKLIKQGKIHANVECNPLLGNLISMVIQKLERGEPVDKEYFVTEEIFTIENVDDNILNRSY